MNTLPRKILSLFSVAAALCLATSTRAVTLYPNAVINGSGVTLSSLLADGWSVEYNQVYGVGAITESMVSTWQTDAGSGYVFVGGIDTDGNVILGATGLASQVLTQTSSTTIATLYGSSNMYWYNVDNVSYGYGSLGFAPIADIGLNQADMLNLEDPYRLSWHTNFDGGGWRLGSHTWLNDGDGLGYDRIVLIAPAGVPDGSSTLGLIGLGLAMLVGFRRRFAK